MIDHDNIYYMRWVAPMFKGPPTDAFHLTTNLQLTGECAPYELHYVDCMEAYGHQKGKEKCRLILEDMYECVTKIKRMRRVHLMEQERQRQYKSGERKTPYEETPPLDLY